MKWKRFMSYWIYFITILIIQVLVLYVAPLLILLALSIWHVLALCMIMIVWIVGSDVQDNLGKNSRMERIGISAIGSFLIVPVMPVCVYIPVYLSTWKWKDFSFSYFTDKPLWIVFGIHFLIMYMSMEVKYLRLCDDAKKEMYDKKPMCSVETNVEKREKHILFMIGSGVFVILITILAVGLRYETDYSKRTVVESFSPKGKYQVSVYQVGEPDFPFGDIHCRIVLTSDDKEIQDYDFSVRNDGGNVSENHFDIRWNTDYVEIIFSGKEQGKQLITMYFAGTVSSEGLEEYGEESEKEAYAGEELDESKVIQEQSFEVELNDWGEVRFVSYLPSDDIYMEDVSFALTKDNQIVYRFPVCYENNSTENGGIGMFDSVAAVGFRDVNGDNAKDVIVIINYVSGAGPQGMIPRKLVRIFQSYDKGFILQSNLMNDIMENMKEDEISIPDICEYLKANGLSMSYQSNMQYVESEEIYEGYCAVYNSYFAEDGYDFIASSSAKGNSRFILKENEESIEFLVYDRLSANNKCELYVLYRSKKAADGSWNLYVAEILDIYAYEIATKEVISSGKTAWSMVGNKQYCEVTGEK